MKGIVNQNTRNVINSIIISTIIVAAVLVAGLSTIMFQTKNVYADNNWYVGKGVKPGRYFTYRIQDHDTKEGQPFIMTIYLNNMTLRTSIGLHLCT
ncbi:MAG TPA: hypothetical protein VH500_03840 [Nitrososphaeraceae archaeon]|jgi:hypothetical protein